MEILTTEEKRELIRKGTRRKLSASPSQPMCSLHEDKELEYFCEPCGMLICGHCMLDKHQVHGYIKYAREVLPSHVEDLRKLIPYVEEVIGSGKEAISNLRSDAVSLNDAFSDRLMGVTNYFAKLRAILDDKEGEITSNLRGHVKQKEKHIQKRIKALEEAVESATKSKLVLEDATVQRAHECSILLEEKLIRTRVQRAMWSVDDEVSACKEKNTNLTSLTPFSPDPSLEEKCKEIALDFPPPLKYRSKTTIEHRERSSLLNAVSPVRIKRKLACRTSSMVDPESRPLTTCMTPISSPSTGTSSERTPETSRNYDADILKPVTEINAKALNGPCNNVNAYPYGVCCTNLETLLVTDAKQNLFRILTNTGKCLEIVGIEGKGDGQFVKPTAIVVDQNGEILVTDGNDPGRVQKFSDLGKRTHPIYPT